MDKDISEWSTPSRIHKTRSFQSLDTFDMRLFRGQIHYDSISSCFKEK